MPEEFPEDPLPKSGMLGRDTQELVSSPLLVSAVSETSVLQ